MVRWIILFIGITTYPAFGEKDRSCPQGLVDSDLFAQKIKEIEICSQGNTNFCALYALKTFLDFWSLHKGVPEHKFPVRVDPAFLAMAYNREVGTGNDGHFEEWLTLSLHKYGAIPKGSRLANRHHWPFVDWARSHNRLIIHAKFLDAILPGPFIGPLGDKIVPQDYLHNLLQFDATSFRWYEAQADSRKPILSEDILSIFRRDSYEETENVISEQAREFELERAHYRLRPDTLYRGLVQQLKTGMPVLASLRIQNELKHHSIIDYEDIPHPESPMETHATVFIARCTSENSELPPCDEFRKEMVARGIEECVLIQNSWGEQAHLGGRACLTPKAFDSLVHKLWLRYPTVWG